MNKTSQKPGKPATNQTTRNRRSKADLARDWNINNGLVSRLFALPGAPAFHKGRIHPDTAAAWRATVNASKTADATEKGHWRKELDRLRCVALSQEIDTEAGLLVTRDEVLQAAQSDAAMIRTGMLGAANVLAPQLLGLTQPEQARRIIDDYLRSMLHGWAVAAGNTSLGDQIKAPHE